MKNAFVLTGMAIYFLAACSNVINEPSATTNAKTDSTKTDTTAAKPVVNKGPVADAATILARTEVPVLCYHHIKEYKPGESNRAKDYNVSPALFAEQLQALADSGYHSILPDQLYDYLAYGTPLPEKPMMLTFDDTDLEQYTVGAAEMKKHGFKGVFFIMTISMNRPRYMSKEQIRELSDDGHVIGCHTWDHHRVTKYTEPDWDIQLVKPRKQLEDITGKPINYFAYPFGLWNPPAIPQLQKRDYKLAFILSTKRDTINPLYTVRRIIVPGVWSGTGMLRALKATFHL